MSLSAGDDVAIVIVALAVLAVFFTVGYLIARRAYRRSEEKQRVLLSTREMELDFDTSDVESAVHGSSKGHSRSWSDDADIPLIRVGHKQWTPSPSKASFDSDVQSVSMYALPTRTRSLSLESGSIQHTLDSIPYALPVVPAPPPIPIIKEPSPPPRSSPPLEPEQPSADHQLGNLVARPSFLTRPRPAPRPGMLHSRSRGGDMRSALLNRLASTRSRRNQGDDADADAEGGSPSSVYSQASALPHGMSEQAAFYEDAPPVPPIPLQFQIETPDMYADEPLISSHLAAPHEAAQLEESIAFPLPNFPEDNMLSLPSRDPGNKLFPGLWANSPSSTSPSPSHSPSDRLPVTPSDGGVISMRSTEVQSGVPQYKMADTEGLEEKGVVGYQLPSNWRNSQSSATISMPTPSTSGAPTPIGYAY